MTTRKHDREGTEKAETAKSTPAAEHPAKKEPKERTFVDAKTGKAIAHPHQGGSGAEANQAVREEMHVARNGSALPFRIGAAVLWLSLIHISSPQGSRYPLPRACARHGKRRSRRRP